MKLWYQTLNWIGDSLNVHFDEQSTIQQDAIYSNIWFVGLLMSENPDNPDQTQKANLTINNQLSNIPDIKLIGWYNARLLDLEKRNILWLCWLLE